MAGSEKALQRVNPWVKSWMKKKKKIFGIYVKEYLSNRIKKILEYVQNWEGWKCLSSPEM